MLLTIPVFRPQIKLRCIISNDIFGYFFFSLFQLIKHVKEKYVFIPSYMLDLKTIPNFSLTKMVKICTHFHIKTAQKPHSLGLTPPPPREGFDCCMQMHCIQCQRINIPKSVERFENSQYPFNFFSFQIVTFTFYFSYTIHLTF